MKRCIGVGAVTLLTLAVAGVYADDALKSGPQKGSKITTPFSPLNINGRAAGKKACQV
jgi:hypothetical protein